MDETFPFRETFRLTREQLEIKVIYRTMAHIILKWAAKA
ncbi:putative uncharacterized protein [Corynebacterium casei UCMA 3821]|uniref:Transposase n=1 Tax=Corynebacterium casei UCMA 3821 TaxID=1110505 RepID=G7I1C2_9CORY|nr:putative uncharacterized protein [Corynebacterium casei UCMA 3821]